MEQGRKEGGKKKECRPPAIASEHEKKENNKHGFRFWFPLPPMIHICRRERRLDPWGGGERAKQKQTRYGMHLRRPAGFFQKRLYHCHLTAIQGDGGRRRKECRKEGAQVGSPLFLPPIEEQIPLVCSVKGSFGLVKLCFPYFVTEWRGGGRSEGKMHSLLFRFT